MKQKRFWLITLICSMFLCLFVGCVDATELRVQLVDEAFRETLYIDTEYDVSSIIEEEEGVTYSLSEVFYFNDEFEEVSIAYQGMKFTQTEPYDVVVEIQAKRGAKTVKKVVELSIEFILDPVLEDFNASYVDTDVIKGYTAKSEYLRGDAKTASSVRYIGSLNPLGAGLNIGGFPSATDDCSAKSWQNPVLCMDVYNSADYKLRIGIMISTKADGIFVYEITHTLPSKAWTRVELALRLYGYTSDRFTLEGDSFSFMLGVPESENIPAPYDHTIYICNMDIADYSAEKFPNLETRTKAEQFGEITDENDRRDLDVFVNAKTSTNYTVEPNTDEENVKVGDASLKYTFTRNETGMPIGATDRGAFASIENGADMSTVSIADWNNLYLGFWIKTDTAFTLAVRFGNLSSMSQHWWDDGTSLYFASYHHCYSIPASDEWQWFEFDLSGMFGGMYKENVTNWRLGLNTEFTGDTFEFYMDDLQLFEQDFSKMETEEALYKKQTHGAGYQVIRESDAVKEGEQALKLSYTHSDVGRETALQIGENGTLIANVESVDWSKDVYVGFWVKSEKAFSMAISFMNYSDTLQKWSGDWWWFTYNTNKSVAANSEWQYMEYNVSELMGSPSMNMPLYDANVSNWRMALITESAENLVYYIDGFGVYNKVIENKTTEELLAASNDMWNYTAEVVMNPVKEGDQAVQYTCSANGYARFIDVKGSALGADMGAIDWTKDVWVGFWVKTSVGICVAPRFDNYQNGTSHGWYINWDGGYVGAKDIAASDEWQYVEWNLTELMASQTAWGNLYTSNVTDWILKIGTCSDKPTFYLDGLSLYNKFEGDPMEENIVKNANHSDNFTVALVGDTVKEGNSALQYTYAFNGAEVKRGSFTTIEDGSKVAAFANVDWSKDVYVGFWVKTDKNINLAVRVRNYASEWSACDFGFYYWCHKDTSASNDWQYLELNVSAAMAGTSYYLHAQNVTNWALDLCAELPDSGTFYVDGIAIYNKETETLLASSAGNGAGYAVSLVADTVKEGSVALQYAYTHSSNGRDRVMAINSGNALVGASVIDWTKDVYVGFWVKTEKAFSLCISFMNCSTTWSGDFWDFTYYTNKSIAANSEWQYVEYNVSELMALAAMNMSLHTENVTDWRMSLASESAESLTFYLDGFMVYNKAE